MQGPGFALENVDHGFFAGASNLKWFRHDADANRDDKLEKVLMRYGAEGYGLYWLCLELIVAPIDKHNLSFELKHDAEILAHRLRMDSIRVEEIMRYFITLGLFESDQTTNRITCLKLARRLENTIVKNLQLKEIQELIKNNPSKSRIIPDSSGKSWPNEIKLNNKDQNTFVDNALALPDQGGVEPPSRPAKTTVPPCPHMEILSLYHEVLPNLRAVRAWTEKRRRLLSTSWKEDDERQSLSWWRAYFDYVKQCPFLMGKSKNEWQADLQWLVTSANLVKVIEGKYQAAA